MKTTFFYITITALLLTNVNSTIGRTGYIVPALKPVTVDTTFKNISDTQFLIAAYNAGIFKLKASHLAHRTTGDHKVKKFTVMIKTDQEAGNKELLALLLIKGCTPPAQLPDSLNTKFKVLNELMGNDFNRTYATGNIADSKSELAMYTAVSMNGKDADIRNFAKHALAQIQMHSDSAQSLLVHINRPNTSGW